MALFRYAPEIVELFPAIVGGVIHATGVTNRPTSSGLAASSATERPSAGEVIFADEADVVAARRWCWRQSAASAAQAETTEILVTVEGHHDTAAVDVGDALDELERLLRENAAPQTVRRAVLTPADPVFE